MKKKLIEVALPLEAINAASAREKSIRHGHPSTLHLWWARRPLAACRAVLFASLVDDPSSHPDKFPTSELQDRERQRLFRIIERLVKWENTCNETVLQEARAEILKSTDGKPPVVLDPFAGGGSIPLEAQRLGLEAHASDLNPVAVLINKALIEIPPRFANKSPVRPMSQQEKFGAELCPELVEGWRGASGLAEDVRYYGRWLRDEAHRRIGRLYPKITLPKKYGGKQAAVIAWLWARTVRCPNPACGAQMPLIRSFWLSTKKGKKAWVKPVVNRQQKTVQFVVETGDGIPPKPPKLGKGAKFRCLVCDQIASEKSIREEFKAKRDSAQMMAIVAESKQGRVYLPAATEQLEIALQAHPKWKPEEEMNDKTSNLVSGRGYGITQWHEIFTARQLATLTTFTDLIAEARKRILADAKRAKYADDDVTLSENGSGARAYTEAVASYLALAVDRSADYWSSICSWISGRDVIRNTFARQAIPMTWDFAEANPFSDSTGNFLGAINWIAKVIASSPGNAKPGKSYQRDAMQSLEDRNLFCIATDPPYYDNIGYADLSDFFYVWLRRSLRETYPQLFSTMATPKANELVASPYRFDGDKAKAKEFFEAGLGKAFLHMLQSQRPDYPTSIFYAYKQTESNDNSKDGQAEHSSTGWETMLTGLISAGFSISGTWPMRSEMGNRTVARDANALAYSILLVCRPRAKDALAITRRQFVAELKAELYTALQKLQKSAIAPVDLAQAAIGPGMAVFSRYSKVVEADGSAMTVRSALVLINQILDESLSEQDSDYDADTQWALAWFEQFGFDQGPFGTAETLAVAKNLSVQGIVETGILEAKAGKVRLLRKQELDDNWDPLTDVRLPVWELINRIVRALETQGEEAAADILLKVPSKAESMRQLAYKLHALCERKGWAKEAMSYNGLVVAWLEITRLAQRISKEGSQSNLFPG